MAKADNASKDAAHEPDRGVDSAVTRDVPLIEIECPPDVHLRVDGKLIEPGERAWVEGAAAINLVQLGHAKITGSK